MIQSDFGALTKYFKALSDRVRLEMLQALSADGETNVSDLAERLEVSQPLVSWHLRPLVRAGLVSVRKEGRSRIYSVRLEGLRPLREWMDAMWDEALARLARLAESEAARGGRGAGKPRAASRAAARRAGRGSRR